MKTLRQFGTMLLMALMTFTITACSGGEPEPEPTPLPYLKIMEGTGYEGYAYYELDSGEQTIVVTCLTNVSNLRIEISHPWITMDSKHIKEDPDSNNVFHYQVYTFRIAANEGLEAREGGVNVIGPNCHGAVFVKQAAPVSP